MQTYVNPYVGEAGKEEAFQKGYEQAYAEPDSDHADPYDGEILEAYESGVQRGRDDRRSEPSEFTPLPNTATEEFTRFESAPDSTLIPIPKEAPQGHEIREDAAITVNPKTAAGYYVCIFNIDPASIAYEKKDEWFNHLATESILKSLEMTIAEGMVGGTALAFELGASVFGVILSIVLFPSPIGREYVFRSYLQDRTPVAYVVISNE